MFDGKFICTLLALVVAVIAICNFDTKKDIKEGLGINASHDSETRKSGSSTEPRQRLADEDWVRVRTRTLSSRPFSPYVGWCGIRSQYQVQLASIS